MRIRLGRDLFSVFGLTLFAACAVDVARDEAAVEVDTPSVEALQLVAKCTDALNDVYAQPKKVNNPKRGDVVRCSKGRKIPMAEISSALTAQAFAGADVQNNVRLYRISYRTQRLGQTPDVASALMALPAGRGDASSASDVDVDDTTLSTAVRDLRKRNKKTLIVYAHGTIPYGQTCADSRKDPLNAPFHGGLDLELITVVALAAHGFPVIMSDFAGFVAGSQVAGYLDSEDEAHSVLDATRAYAQLSEKPQDQVVLVGHSQGGHAVLSAQAIAKSYGLSGKLSGVVALAPFWAVARFAAGVVARESMLNTTDNGALISPAIEYLYTHAELHDGPGAGAALFAPAPQPAFQQFVSTCDFDASDDPSVLGPTSDSFLSADFLDQVGLCGLVGGEACGTPLGQVWEPRFRADRPKLDPSGAPVVLWQGAQDLLVTPDLAKCGVEKIQRDPSPTFKLCGDADADHETIESRNTAWVTRWIEARTQGAPDTLACPGAEAFQNSVLPFVCPEVPGNED